MTCLSPAAAAITQPGSTVTIPVAGTGCVVNSPSDVGVCLNQNEVTLGAAATIDAQTDARVDRETFNPLCSLTFSIVHRGAEFQNTFGWYEVVRDAAGAPVRPALSELNVFLDCSDPPGTVRELALPVGVREIGFFMANDGMACVTQGGAITTEPENLFFSEPALNGAGRYQLLTWQSLANTTAFYFGWEDDRGSGDDDFDDLLTYVSGIQCAGSGGLCKTGQPGVCEDGTEQCRSGDLVCVPIQEPGPEACNALDDDCDGETDEGDLCTEGEICSRGRCVPRCGTGEFACAVDSVCEADVCIERACAGVICEPGTICRRGSCVGACDGVRCPYGQACRAGVCVGACEGVECDAGYACEVAYPVAGGDPVGRCSSCDCRGCEGGLVCSAHLCVEPACETVACTVGQHCSAGTCVDNCLGASCPAGQLCASGACIAEPSAGMGGGGAGGAGGTVVIAGGAGSGGRSAAGAPSSGGMGGQAGTGSATPPPSSLGQTPPSSQSGCACRRASSDRSASGALFLAFVSALAASRWRRGRLGRGE